MISPPSLYGFLFAHIVRIDAQRNACIGDRSNVGAPYVICISPGPHQYSNPSPPMENREIYKILSKFGTARGSY
jgi:hypothetical protein